MAIISVIKVSIRLNLDLNFTIFLCIKHLCLLSVGELALFAKLDDERDRGNELQVTLRITVKVTTLMFMFDLT